MVGVTVHVTVFVVMLSASVTCMTLPEKFLNRVMQDVIAEIIEDERQNLDRPSDREVSMKCVRENFESIKSCSTKCEKKSDDMLSCMMKVAKMDTPLDYTERQYLGYAITKAALVLYQRWAR